MLTRLHHIILMVLVGCSAPQVTEIYDGPILEQIESSRSGITFSNDIQESVDVNVLTYDYFYNGGGVAIGDLNDDGLADIYFTANQSDNALFINKGNLNFEDKTESAGVAGLPGWSTGVTMTDVNGDGLLDIYIAKSGNYHPQHRRNELYVNNGDLTFTERAAEFGIDDPGYSTHASFFDYDNDGDLDLFLLNHSIKRESNALVAQRTIDDNAGDRFYEFVDGKFHNASVKVGIRRNSLGYGLGVATSDLNNDGFIDIYVTNDYTEPDYMYLNNGNQSFREVIKEKTNHISLSGMGCDIADINNDGLMDIIVADMVAEDNYRQKINMMSMNPTLFNGMVRNGFHYQYMANTLQLNNGNSFSEIGQLAGIANTDWSWSTLMVDLDNDRFRDIVVSNGYRKESTNKDFMNYMRIRMKEMKWADKEMRESIMGDLLNRLESQPIGNYVFRNNKNLTFTKVSGEWGFDQPSFSNGMAYGDLDNDGDLELVVNNIDEEAFLFKNLSRENETGNFIKVQFQGPHHNRFGFGAKVILEVGDDQIISEQFISRGYQSSVDQVLTIGIGNWTRIDRVQIVWPGNYIEEIENIHSNTTLLAKIENAAWEQPNFARPRPFFSDITQTSGIEFVHKENVFDDYFRESLLPHKMSTFGPGLAVGDVNADGYDDFYVGGASGQSGQLYLQNENSTFTLSSYAPWSAHSRQEDMGALFFDFDNDGDLDLYVVSGGNERPSGSDYYQDRIYENLGSGGFRNAEGILPKIISSGSRVITNDFDRDGDADLVVCGRQVPGQYPFPATTILLENKEGRFEDATDRYAPDLIELGMVTDAKFIDLNDDSWDDLVLVGEWMSPVLLSNKQGRFEANTPENITNQSGWWFSLAIADINRDGLEDIVGGNLGLNYKYKTSPKEPFQVFVNDFDESGSYDIVLGYFNAGELYPVRGRQCSSEQIPEIREQFPDYASFGIANLEEVYGEGLESALNYKATTFASSIFLSEKGNGYQVTQLPVQAQISSINGILVEDYNRDGHQDLFVAGNLFSSEVETPRNDAGIGLLLLGDGNGKFKPVHSRRSGVELRGDTKEIKAIRLANGAMGILIANNQDKVQLLELKNKANNRLTLADQKVKP